MELANMVIGGQKVILIDTPGFDDTYRSNADVLELIAKHLSNTYEAGKLLNGIILLQPINMPRVQGNERKSTRLFEKICGPGAFCNVVIASTFWSEISDQKQGIRREQERIKSDDFWGKMISQGARTARHENTAASAIKIVSMLLSKQTVELQMQREMADNGNHIGSTSAGRQLNVELNEQCAKLAQELAETREDARQTNQDLRADINELEAKIADLQEQNRKLESTQVKKGSSGGCTIL